MTDAQKNLARVIRLNPDVFDFLLPLAREGRSFAFWIVDTQYICTSEELSFLLAQLTLEGVIK